MSNSQCEHIYMSRYRNHTCKYRGCITATLCQAYIMRSGLLVSGGAAAPSQLLPALTSDLLRPARGWLQPGARAQVLWCRGPHRLARRPRGQKQSAAVCTPCAVLLSNTIAHACTETASFTRTHTQAAHPSRGTGPKTVYTQSLEIECRLSVD